ncbi:MAG: hypothetical protein L3J65_03300 [Robiginitomaculum sp.]|nr:hypothetical protein [Robiginitomaculum sp.]
MIAQAQIGSKISNFLWPSSKELSDSSKGSLNRLALMTAMLSVCFEKAGRMFKMSGDVGLEPVLFLIGMFLTLPFVLVEKFSRIAIFIFVLFLLPSIFTDWVTYANHSWLAVWTIPAALLFAKFWQAPLFSDYLRITLGVVMLGAFAQKILAGTYWDGSYIAYLSHYGSTTENMFKFMCSDATLLIPCGWHRFIGIFLLAWQFTVGVLLLVGVRSLLFLFVEISFLLGAGLYADEMNFQVLNIALLCVAFKVGMSHRLFVICCILLVVDMHGIGEFIRHVT